MAVVLFENVRGLPVQLEEFDDGEPPLLALLSPVHLPDVKLMLRNRLKREADHRTRPALVIPLPRPEQVDRVDVVPAGIDLEQAHPLAENREVEIVPVPGVEDVGILEHSILKFSEQLTLGAVILLLKQEKALV